MRKITQALKLIARIIRLNDKRRESRFNKVYLYRNRGRTGEFCRTKTPQLTISVAPPWPHEMVSWGVPQAPSFQFIMHIKRHLIRLFLQGAEWATPRNIIILANGTYTSKGSQSIRTELNRMTAVKQGTALIKLSCKRGAAYAFPDCTKRDVGGFMFDHNEKLRDCLARYLCDRKYKGIDDLTTKTPNKKLQPDARIGDRYFELDNGHMDDKQLKEKIKNYSGKGKFQVIFIMTTRYKAHWRTKEDIKKLEQKRLRKLLEIARQEIRQKPNRILANAYEDYLETGQLYNFKQYDSTEEKTTEEKNTKGKKTKEKKDKEHENLKKSKKDGEED